VESFYRQQGYQRLELNATLQAMQRRIREKRRGRVASEGDETIGSTLKQAKKASEDTKDEAGSTERSKQATSIGDACNVGSNKATTQPPQALQGPTRTRSSETKSPGKEQSQIPGIANGNWSARGNKRRDIHEAFLKEVEEQKKKSKIRRLNNSAIAEIGIVEAKFEPRPQLPGTPIPVEAILKRIGDDAKCPIKQGMQSGEPDVRVRREADEPTTRFVQGIAKRIRKDEVLAISRILNPCIGTSPSVSIRNNFGDVCSSEAGPGDLFKRSPA